MTLTKNLIAAIASVLLAGFGEAQAQTLVYDNGPINASITGWYISLGDVVSDSFTVTSATTLGSVHAGLWTDPSDSVSSLQWSIGTTPFGSDISSGTSATTDTPFGVAYGYYDVDEDIFGINGTVGPGTYYLTLQNAVTADGVAAWDENDGPSAAYETPFGGITGSESFQVYGGSSSVPDGGLTFAMLGTVMSGLTLIRRKSASRQ